MRLQNIAINDRFGHVIDYDSNNAFVENFVVEAPTDGYFMPLIAFSTDNAGAFIVEADQKSEIMFLKQAELSLGEGNFPKVLNICLNFSNVGSAVRSSAAKVPGSIFTANSSTPSAQTGEVAEQPIAKWDEQVALSWSDSSVLGKKVLMLDMLDLSQSNLKIVVNFTLELQGKLRTVKSKTIHIYVSPKKTIVDVLLDFGSEATQMSVYARNENIDISGFSELFTNIRRNLAGEQDTRSKDADYYQFDASSKKLFRSYFFLKKSLTQQEVADTLDDFSTVAQRSLLKALITKSDVQSEDFKRNYFVSPNVKLGSYGGIELPKVQVDDEVIPTDRVGGAESFFFYRSSISLFIQQGLKAAIHKDGNIHFVSFHFLMPNVYKQADIILILRALQQDISRLLEKSEYNQLWGFEVTAISESDASVMGVIEFLRSQNKTPEDGNYLLLDAGKGTLDFSLVNYKYDLNTSQRTYTNLWRSGIIGAGNSLTYAYLLALLHQYLEERYDGIFADTSLQQFIYRNILGEGKNIVGAGDPALLLNLMQLVDQYKIFDSAQRDDVRTKEDVKDDNLDNFRLEGFISWLENGVDIINGKVQKLTHPVYVEKMIAALVNESINRIMDMQQGRDEDVYKIDYIIFAGRSFNHAPFKAAMYKAITQLFDGTEIKFMNSNAAISMKDICLVCVNPIRMGNYNRKILSLPALIQRSNCASMESKDAKKDNSENLKYKSWFTKILNKLFGMKEKEESALEPSLSSVTMITDIKSKAKKYLSSYTSTYSLADQNTLKVSDLKITNPRDARINIGGVIYPLNGVGEGIINVFFNGEEHKVRYNGTIIEFAPLMQLATSSFLQSSFFPYFKPVSQSEVILVPHTDCIWNTCADATESVKDATNSLDTSKSEAGKSKKSGSALTDSVSDKEEAKLKNLLDKSLKK